MGLNRPTNHVHLFAIDQIRIPTQHIMMANNIRLTVLSVVICMTLLTRPSRTVTVGTNGYDFTIAIADQVKSVTTDNQAAFLSNIQVHTSLYQFFYFIFLNKK